MPDEQPSVYGEMDAAGNITRDVLFCAVSGERIESGDVLVSVPNSRAFYRVKAPIFRRMNDNQRDEIANAAVHAITTPPQPQAPTPSPRLPTLAPTQPTISGTSANTQENVS